MNNDTKILFRKLGREQARGQFDFESKTIEVDPRQYFVKSVLSTICHEIVHAKQYQKGVFWAKVIKSNTIYYWRDGNSILEFNSSKMLNKCRYEDLPWESEAYTTEAKMKKTI